MIDGTTEVSKGAYKYIRKFALYQRSMLCADTTYIIAHLIDLSHSCASLSISASRFELLGQ